ncbi:MAG: acyl-CoA dehydrogenase [Deltaproteobacteria bacterium]|nr:acyl-CoA dehydrogenase [Deltaproteobacteria bacterium]
MPERTFNTDLRDMRFALFEHLSLAELQALPPYAQLDEETILMMIDEAARFAREVLAPINRPGDQIGAVYANGRVTMPPGFAAAYKAIRETGWLGLLSPESRGGLGMPLIMATAIGELYTGACCSLALSLGLTTSTMSLLENAAPEALKAIYLPKLQSGEWQGTMCLTEPQAGSAVGDIQTTARRDGDAWLIRGTKIFITGGEHDMVDNHVHLVLSRTEGAPKGFKGLSLFVVPKFRPTPDGKPGEPNDVTCAGIEHKMGIKASPTCVMQFGDADKCRAWLLGEEGQGLPLMFHMMNEARVAVGLQGLSLAAQAYYYALEYANERVQGVDVENFKNPDAPRVVISQHPNVRRMLLWSKAVVEGSRALLYKTSFFADVARHSPDPKAAGRAKALLEVLTPICKAYCTDLGFEVTRVSMQCMGGYGYLQEYPVEQHLRDVKIASIYEGTNDIQALDLLGRKLPAQGGLLFRTLVEELSRFTEAHKQHNTLGKELGVFAEELGRLQAVSMELAAQAFSADRRYPVLCASSYLEMAGGVVMGWLLLEQGVIAQEKLEAIYAAKGASEAAARSTLHQEDPEARFYFNKVETARFFTHQILTRNQTIASQIRSQDRSALTFLP